MTKCNKLYGRFTLRCKSWQITIAFNICMSLSVLFQGFFSFFLLSLLFGRRRLCRLRFASTTWAFSCNSMPLLFSSRIISFVYLVWLDGCVVAAAQPSAEWQNKWKNTVDSRTRNTVNIALHYSRRHSVIQCSLCATESNWFKAYSMEFRLREWFDAIGWASSRQCPTGHIVCWLCNSGHFHHPSSSNRDSGPGERVVASSAIFWIHEQFKWIDRLKDKPHQTSESTELVNQWLTKLLHTRVYWSIEIPE